MTTNTYTLKEILFGLRDEYLNITSKIKELENLLQLENSSYEKASIMLIKIHNKEVTKLYCYLYERKNKLEKIIDPILKKLGIYLGDNVFAIEEQNNQYTIQKHSEIISNKKEFNEKVIKILNEDFSKNSANIYDGTVYDYDYKPFLSVIPGDIYASTSNEIQLEYIPSRDEFIHIHSFKGKLTKERIENIFNWNFSKNKFPEYYQQIIETSDKINKKLEIIDDHNYSKDISFEIIEEPQKLILKKKR